MQEKFCMGNRSLYFGREQVKAAFGTEWKRGGTGLAVRACKVATHTSTGTGHRHLLQEWSLPTRDGGRQENPCPRADPCGAEQKAGGVQRSQQGGAGAGGGSSGKAGGGQ